MINTVDEATLHLMTFSAAMLAIAVRESVVTADPHPQLKVAAKFEARMIAEAVVEEAKRLRVERKA